MEPEKTAISKGYTFSTSSRNAKAIGGVVLLMAAVSLVLLLLGSISDDYGEWTMKYVTKVYRSHWPIMLADVAIWFGVLIGLAMYTGWDDSSLKRVLSLSSGSSMHDVIAWTLRTFYIPEVAVYLLTYGLFIRTRWAVSGNLGIEEKYIPSLESLVLQQICFLLVIDFVYYWMHRFEHKLPFLWAFHKFHHTASEMNAITARRVHPIESEVIKSTFFVLPFALLGVPFVSFIVIKMILHAHSALVHSGTGWTWGWFGKYVLVSPRLHEIHHSLEDRHRDKNFANQFIFLDRVFGTYMEDERPTKYGVPDDNHNDRHYLAALWIGLVESADAVSAWISLNKKSE